MRTCEKHPCAERRKSGHCSMCQAEYHRAYYEKNRAKYIDRGKAYYEVNRFAILEKQKSSSETRRKAQTERRARGRNSLRTNLKKYGLTLGQYDEMLQNQAGACAVCLVVFSASPCVDHCHRTGVIRGLLCNICNLSLGQFTDDPERFMRAAAYLVAASVKRAA